VVTHRISACSSEVRVVGLRRVTDLFPCEEPSYIHSSLSKTLENIRRTF
jgi:hypothetical protein